MANAEWRPGQAVVDATKISDLAAALAFGQSDDTYITLAEMLSQRGCDTVGKWRTWTKGEFFTLIKSKSDLKMKKHRNAYLTGFESATRQPLRIEAAAAGDGNGLIKSEKKRSGGDMLQLSRKVVSSTFNGSKWEPDALVYEGLPKKGEVEFLGPEDEKLYMDKLWLCAQVLARLPTQHGHGMRAHAARGTHTVATSVRTNDARKIYAAGYSISI